MEEENESKTSSHDFPMLFCERFAGCAGTVANIPGGEEWKKVSDGGDGLLAMMVVMAVVVIMVKMMMMIIGSLRMYDGGVSTTAKQTF